MVSQEFFAVKLVVVRLVIYVPLALLAPALILDVARPSLVLVNDEAHDHGLQVSVYSDWRSAEDCSVDRQSSHPEQAT